MTEWIIEAWSGTNTVLYWDGQSFQRRRDQAKKFLTEADARAERDLCVRVVEAVKEYADGKARKLPGVEERLDQAEQWAKDGHHEGEF